MFFGWGQGEQGDCQQPPDIRDPWELPKIYAEDLYTGGPIRERDRSGLSPSRLTPSAEEIHHSDNIGSQHRPFSIPVPQPVDLNFAETPQGPATPALIPLTTNKFSNSDDEVSFHDEDVLELDTPTTAALRAESDFVSFTALNQPSDAESERGGPEVLYISDDDGGEVSEDDKAAEEDELDDDGLIPLGTSDLEIPAEHRPGEDGGEELDELEDDEEPVVEVSPNHPYGYYGLDASSITGSGGIDDETRTVGPPRDAPNGGQSEIPGMTISQESVSLLDPRTYLPLEFRRWWLMFSLPDNPAPLPAAATFIDIDHHLQSGASAVTDKATKISFAEVSHTLPDGIPTISDEVVVGIEDPGTADEDSVGDDTVISDGAVLTANEVEEVLRDAFAETDRLVPIPDAQGSTTSVGDFLTSGHQGPSLGCIDIGYPPIC